MPGHDTGFHDHDGCSGAVAVVEGAVREERIRWAHVPAARTVAGRRVFDFGVADIHRVLHTGTGPAVTIHALLAGPASWAPTSRPGGVLQRHVVPEGEELRADAFAAPRRGPRPGVRAPRTGSSAASLTSVSASSAAGSESRTTPTPA